MARLTTKPSDGLPQLSRYTVSLIDDDQYASSVDALEPFGVGVIRLPPDAEGAGLLDLPAQVGAR